jgi:hypothetical protein
LAHPEKVHVFAGMLIISSAIVASQNTTPEAPDWHTYQRSPVLAKRLERTPRLTTGPTRD